jgi:hypothetical protein
MKTVQFALGVNDLAAEFQAVEGICLDRVVDGA